MVGVLDSRLNRVSGRDAEWSIFQRETGHPRPVSAGEIPAGAVLQVADRRQLAASTSSPTACCRLALSAFRVLATST
jgi:hypothetical protein